MFVCACFCVLLIDQPAISVRTIGRAVVTFAIALLIMFTSFRRSRLGVSGPLGESMFVDLRDRISKQGNLPALPEDWLVESVAKSAGGTSFAGDFIVARRSADDWLDLVVVDVSGKGVEAGSRALFLSGAFNGIVSALPGDQFLPAANDYLLGQEWDEGFATAIHLHLDLVTGDFELRKAGHPPAVWLHAGSGRWTVLNSDGPVLGLIDGRRVRVRPRHPRGRGRPAAVHRRARRDGPARHRPGDGQAGGPGRAAVPAGFDGGARMLIDTMEQTNDDRALVMVHRR